jgi:sugar O-acyltransferase (sialic acid O-acetyltransferase NeuD family)
MKRLLIAGAGGFGREVYAWAKAHPDCGCQWEIAGFLDDNANALDGLRHPGAIVGSVTAHMPSADEVFLCAIGAPAIKRAVCEKLLKRSAEFISLVHPTAILGANVAYGRGVIFCPYTVVTCDVVIGDFVAINCHSSVGHDVRIADWVTLSGHCDVTGQTQLGEGAFLGSGARILPLKRIGAGALVGAGSVVISHVPAGAKVFGNPARVFE